jgi:hypothetical protein
VHVDAIESILTRAELKQVVKAAREMMGVSPAHQPPAFPSATSEVHCLAWEFQMDLRLVCHALEASVGAEQAHPDPARSWRRTARARHLSWKWRC